MAQNSGLEKKLIIWPIYGFLALNITFPDIIFMNKGFLLKSI